MVTGEPIFKYTDSSGAIKTLEGGRLKFTRPRDFNDPMDVRKSICCESLNDKSLLKMLIRKHIQCMMADTYEPNAKFQEEFTDMVKTWRRERIGNKMSRQDVIANTPSHEYSILTKSLCGPDNSIDRQWRDKLSRTYVCCFSKLHPTDNDLPRSNQLMWAHYANKHAGVALGFVFKSRFIDKASKVKYKSELPVIITDETASDYCFGLIETPFNITIDTLYCTKSRCWEYEKEWRIVAEYDSATGTMATEEFDKDELVTIHFGVLCSREDRICIAKLAGNYPNARLYQTTVAPGTFMLSTEEYAGE
jgi:Protein of unknown function (DUF2971)